MLKAIKVKMRAMIDDVTLLSPEELEAKFAEKLLSYRRIKVPGLGIFEIRRMQGKNVRHPITGEEIYSPPYNKLRFLPSKSLRRRIQEDNTPEEVEHNIDRSAMYK